MHNIELILFSLLSQASVGLFLVYAFLHFISRDTSDLEKAEPAVSLSAFVIALAGLVISFSHLGTPINAFNSLNNLAGSWMSREILFQSLFLATMAAIYLASKRSKRDLLSVVLRNTGSLLAIILLYSMIKVWSVPDTTIAGEESVLFSFLTSSVFTGSAILAGITAKNRNRAGNLLFLSLFALLTALLNMLIYTSKLPVHHRAALPAVALYLAASLASIPAMIPRFKNIFTFSAVIFVILGFLAEFLNRLILISFTSYNI